MRVDAGDTVLVLAGDHIYKMDYEPFVAAHRRHRADVTIAVRPVPLDEAHRFGILALDDSDARRGVAGEAEPARAATWRAWASTSSPSAPCSSGSPRRGSTSARHVIPAMLEAGARVFGYRFDGYWQDVGTIESYWQANMDLLAERPELDLYDREWVIHTRSEERPPARIGPTATVHRSMVSHGCVIYGTVERSVLSPGRPRRHRRRRPRQHRHVRHRHPGRRGGRPGDHRQERDRLPQ